MVGVNVVTFSTAWEATDALRKRLAAAGYSLQGKPGGWTEVMRVIRECKACYVPVVVGYAS